jgi:hypothetical protein
MTLAAHLRLIWPNRRFTLCGDALTFEDGQPAPTEAELAATLTQAQALLAAEQATPPPPIPDITQRQFRLWLIENGKLDAAKAIINGMPSGKDKAKAQTEWEYASIIKRTHPLTSAIGQALGMSDAQLDQAFRDASEL